MTVKFKVGFTISAETLFGIIAKFLPVDDLNVEEVAPAEPRAIAKAPRLALRPPKPNGRGPNLDRGANGAILAVLADGQPHRYRDLKKAVIAAGLAGTGLGAKLTRLRELGAAEPLGDGSWRITQARKTA